MKKLFILTILVTGFCWKAPAQSAQQAELEKYCRRAALKYKASLNLTDEQFEKTRIAIMKSTIRWEGNGEAIPQNYNVDSAGKAEQALLNKELKGIFNAAQYEKYEESLQTSNRHD